MTRDAKIALVLFLTSLLVLLVISSAHPLGPASSGYADQVSQAEGVVLTVAHDGLASLAAPAEQRAVASLGNRPLLPLLSAWAALSLGRNGSLDASTSMRLPWLLLAAGLVACVFGLARGRLGVRSAVLASIWLLASPGFVASALLPASDALVAWPPWLALGAATCAARARQTCDRVAWGLCTAAAIVTGSALSWGALCALPLLIVHGWLSAPRFVRASSRSGFVPVSLGVLTALVVLPGAVYAADPALWHAQVPALIRRVFEQDEFRALEPLSAGLGAGWVALALGLVGAAVLARTALARRFATGVHRPCSDPGSLTVTVFLAAVGCTALAAWAPSLARLLALPALACAIAAGVAWLSQRFARTYAPLAELAWVLLALLVR